MPDHEAQPDGVALQRLLSLSSAASALPIRGTCSGRPMMRAAARTATSPRWTFRSDDR
jgi:hypothetical protein